MMILSVLLAVAPARAIVNPYAGPHIKKTFTYAVSSPVSIDVSTLNGRISVMTGPAGKVEIVANERAGSQAALGALNVEVKKTGSNVAIAGQFPADCGTTCGSVDMTITVPSDTSLTAHVDSGSIGVEGISGSVTASSVRGPVLCNDLAGNVKLSSENGMLNAGFRDLSKVKNVDLQAETGVVRVVLPKVAKIATLRASTEHGKIFSPWAGDAVQKGDGAQLERSMTSSGPAMVLGTGKGDVNIVLTP